MENVKWISTEQLIENLLNEPDNDQEYRRHIGGILFSTHWCVYDSKRGQFGDSTDFFEYEWFTQEELLDCYAGARWHRDA